jgi:hypothetical protein
MLTLSAGCLFPRAKRTLRFKRPSNKKGPRLDVWRRYFYWTRHGLSLDSPNHVYGSFSKSEGIVLQTDITMLEHRQKVLEKEIDETLSHAPIDDLMIAYLKSRILYVKEEIVRLRHEAFVSYH